VSEEDSEVDDAPDFEDVFPDLDVAGKLLAALARDDHDAIGELRATDADWWNVAWTLALLIRGVHDDEPAAVGLVAALLGDDSASPAE
jgi:hypothetical protein